MNRHFRSVWIFPAVCWGLFLIVPAVNGGEWNYELDAAPAPADNPLKGLVPYARPRQNRFPHSMEFSYLPLSDLMVGPDRFDWQPLESLLEDIASRGNQAIVRIYLEYPGKDKGIPQFLIDAGMKVHRYVNTNTAPLPPATIITPDYQDTRLHAALRSFIQAWGKRYDGDPRLAYITAGLLGTWGEWHTYPRDELWASKATQDLVLEAYEAAFPSTPVLLRYPAGPDHYAQTENASRPFGYHDDSFAWATLDTGRKSDNWFYMPAIKAAGRQAMEKWKTHPIGGEIRPEVWGKIFDGRDRWPQQAQSFRECVSETHATWLMDTGMFRERASRERMQRALREVRQMGYAFYIPRVRFATEPAANQLEIEIDLVNQGVAPFYADWPTELAFVSNTDKIVKTATDPKLAVRGLLPGKHPHRLSADVSLDGLSGQLTVLMRVVHPLPGGKPLRFANADQNRTRDGWLTLGTIELAPLSE